MIKFCNELLTKNNYEVYNINRISNESNNRLVSLKAQHKDTKDIFVDITFRRGQVINIRIEKEKVGNAYDTIIYKEDPTNEYIQSILQTVVKTC